MILEKARVRRCERAFLHLEIPHLLDHQTILIRVVHVMELQRRVRLEQPRGRRPERFERVTKFIRMHAIVVHGNQHCLRQPWNSERGAEVHHRTVG